MITTKQKPCIKYRKKLLKSTIIRESHQTTKGDSKLGRNKRRTYKIIRKENIKEQWQVFPINNYHGCKWVNFSNKKTEWPHTRHITIRTTQIKSEGLEKKMFQWKWNLKENRNSYA